ncbi:E3 ubiquitin-protein ligase [Fusarium oxysporum f. sp. albedinis]|nr:E3 ubiquitin-protein ligase [Fusarium oxysporum f. sp. albedinis]
MPMRLSPASGMEGREKAKKTTKKHFACEGTGSTSAWRRSLACGYAKYISTYTYLHMSAMAFFPVSLCWGS